MSFWLSATNDQNGLDCLGPGQFQPGALISAEKRISPTHLPAYTSGVRVRGYPAPLIPILAGREAILASSLQDLGAFL